MMTLEAVRRTFTSNRRQAMVKDSSVKQGERSDSSGITIRSPSL